MPLKIGQRPDHGFDEPLQLLSDCHRRIEHFLELLRAITKQAGGEGLDESQRAQLQSAIDYFTIAGPRHTADEEESLFPRLAASKDAEARKALETMERLEGDHANAAAHHEVVDRLVRRWIADGALPPADVQDLSERLDALAALYSAHIAVEDHELFPAAGRVLSSGDVQAIGREMAARRKSSHRKS
jgi:hemerythrin-like domain-containing protein